MYSFFFQLVSTPGHLLEIFQLRNKGPAMYPKSIKKTFHKEQREGTLRKQRMRETAPVCNILISEENKDQKESAILYELYRPKTR